MLGAFGKSSSKHHQGKSFWSTHSGARLALIPVSIIILAAWLTMRSATDGVTVRVRDSRPVAGHPTNQMTFSTGLHRRPINPPPPYFINDAFRRVGYVGGTAKQVSRLLERDTAVMAPYDTVVDIGAFDGVDYTVPAYKLGYIVYTFEPDPQNRNRLLSSIHGEGWKEGADYTLIVPTASTTIADIRAQVDQVLKVQQHRKHIFVIGAGCGGERATFALTKSEELAEVVPIQQGTVLDPSARTVEIVPLQGIIPDDAMIYILKVDVQGHEKAVFDGSGGRPLFDRVRSLALEFWPEGLHSRGSDPVAVLERIYAEYGMTCYDMGFHEKYIPANRDGEIGAYVRFLLGIPRSLDILGGWEDLVCM
ncbi:Methyltransferase FkbM domain-containing protein [Plasmodiophora brassicae]